MSSEPIVLDNTKRSTFRQCKYKYFLQFLKGMQPDFGSTSLRYGTTWHGIQEGFHKFIKEHGWPTEQTKYIEAISAGLELGKEKWDSESAKKQFFDDYKNFNTAVEAFQAYLTFFADDSKYIKVLATEQKFECPIEPENLAEEMILKTLPPIIFTGRIDLQVEMDNMKWIWDFKTTGWILDQVISKANRSPQLIGYSYAGKRVLDFEPDGCLCSFAYVGASKSKKTGEYGSPRFDFRRVPQLFTPEDIEAWKMSFLDACKDIKWSMDNGIWAQSFDNCYQYGQCPYMKLCKQHCDFDELNLQGYHVEFWDVLEEE